MMKKFYTPGQRNALPPQAVIAILAILALLVGGLAVFAIKQGGSSAAAGIPTSSAQPPTAEPSVPAPTAEPTEEPSADPTEEPIPEEPEITAISAVVPDRLITPVNKDVIVRSTVGSCEAPGILEVSKDGGETWEESTAFAETGSTMVLRVIPTRATLIQVVALDEDCEPHLVRTENQGRTWFAPIDPEGAWFFEPGNPNSIYAPGGKVAAPCEVAYLAAGGDNAAVLCTDSSIITTEDRADTWNEPVSVRGAIALNVSDANYIVAIANQNECVGIQTQMLRGSDLDTPSTCVEKEIAEATVSVARTPDTIFTWYGENFASSPDGGKTWQ